MSLIVCLSACGSHADVRVDDQLSFIPAPDWTWHSMQNGSAGSNDPVPVSATLENTATALLVAEKNGTPFPSRFSVFRLNAGTAGGAADGEDAWRELVQSGLSALMAQGFVPTSYNRIGEKWKSQTPMRVVEVTGRRLSNEEQGLIIAATIGVRDVVRAIGSYPVADTNARSGIFKMLGSLSASAGAAQPGTQTAASSAPAPAQPAPVPAAAPAENAAGDAGRLVSDHRSSLLLVEGSKGVGSGFLCKLGGATVAFTNIHVLAHNSGVKLTSIDHVQVPSGKAQLAVEHDVAVIAVQTNASPFELLDKVDQNAKIGDAVVVLGNSDGAGVVHPVSGKITGIGPKLLEIDAEFVPGNSGSPIIHVPTGKVIGIATYILQKRVSQEEHGVKTEARRFGYRLDSIARWQPVDWPSFFSQSAQVAAIEAGSEDFIHMFQEAQKSKRLDTANYQNPAINRALLNFNDVMSRSGVSASDQQSALRRLFGELRAASQSDIAGFRAPNCYDFFGRKVAEQAQFREEIYKVFTDLMQKH